MPTGSKGEGSGYINSTRLVEEGETWIKNAKSTSEWGMEKIIAIQNGLGDNTKHQFGGKYGQIIGPEIGATIEGWSTKGAGIPVYYYFPFVDGKDFIENGEGRVGKGGRVRLQIIVTLPECKGTKNKKGKDKQDVSKPARSKGTPVPIKPNDCGGVSGDRVYDLETGRGMVVLYNVPSGTTGVRFRMVNKYGEAILFKSKAKESIGFKWTDILASTHFKFQNTTIPAKHAETGRGGAKKKDKDSIFELLKDAVSLSTLELLVTKEPDRAREKDAQDRSVVQAARDLGREDVVEFFLEEGFH